MHQDQRPSYFVNLGWGPGRTLWLRAGAVQLRCKRCKSMWHPHNWRGELGRRCTKQKGAVLRCTSQGWRGNRYDWTPGRELRRRLRGQAEGGGSSHLTHRTALGGRSYYNPRWSNFPQLAHTHRVILWHLWGIWCRTPLSLMDTKVDAQVPI